MKRAAAVAVMALGLSIGVPASADIIVDFAGPYDPSTWITTILGNLGAQTGTATFTSTSLTLVGGDAPSPDPANFVPACTGAEYGLLGPCEIDVTTTVANPFTFTFDYLSGDADGPAGDIFGVLVDGVRINLSDPGGPISQGGQLSFVANTSFGWFINCTDCINGAASATISGFATTAAVPEPGSLALVGMALGGVWLVRRRPKSIAIARSAG